MGVSLETHLGSGFSSTCCVVAGLEVTDLKFMATCLVQSRVETCLSNIVLLLGDQGFSSVVRGCWFFRLR